MADKKTAIIIGAGPAGLTAALEIVRRTDIKPVVFEMSRDIGGISKTVHYKGNRIDIGGHRFFSKSDRVMRWWQEIFPVQDQGGIATARNNDLPRPAVDPARTDKVLLIRQRLSRIFFLRKFFDYPISFSLQTVLNLGMVTSFLSAFSYLIGRMFPRRPETSLEDFFINRFGKRLYDIFFKDYTEKVWGIPCCRISAEWGAQRVKGLSIGTAIAHAFKRSFRSDQALAQKNIETSLIERFLYPKYGPGQLWEEVAERVRSGGGMVSLDQTVIGVSFEKQRVAAVTVRDNATGRTRIVTGDYVISTMPVKELIAAMDGVVPAAVRDVAAGLVYRDFVTVGMLVSGMKIRQSPDMNRVPDNWIYIQERDVRLGRVQIFNNWSPYLVKDPETVWLGLEYFCNEKDAFWDLSDEQIRNLAIEELCSIGMIEPGAVLDSTVIRVPKTYPAYFGTYDRFDRIKEFTDRIENLFLVGRNGMHRYNNMDHSMLSAMAAVENILQGRTGKEEIWGVNAEQEYHEEK